jgi:hypothetical protein
MNIRKSAIAIALFLIVSIGAYTGYWFYAREVAAAIIDDWTRQQRAEGYEVAYSAPVFSGYPLLIRAVLDQPQVRRNDFAWRGEGLSIESQPWNFRRLRVDIRGKQWITLAHDPAPFVLTPAKAAIVAKLSDDGSIAEASVLFRDLSVSQANRAALSKVSELWLEAIAPKKVPQEHTDNNLSVSLSAVDITLPETAIGPLGRNVAKLRADIKLKGTIPNAAFGEAIETWRRSGGTLDVDWFHIIWGTFDLRAKGTIALDAQARPLGAFSTDVRGHSQALDALVSHAVLEQKTATLAKLGLSLLIKTPPDGGTPVLTVPVTAQDGHLYAGPIKVFELPPLRF